MMYHYVIRFDVTDYDWKKVKRVEDILDNHNIKYTVDNLSTIQCFKIHIVIPDIQLCAVLDDGELEIILDTSSSLTQYYDR